MKKVKLYTLFILLITFCFTSCSSETKTKEKKISKATTAPTSIKEYKDNTITCSYDELILKCKESTPNGNLKYGVVFSDDLSTMSDDVINGSCLYVATQSHSIAYKDWMLPIMTESLFNGTFGIDENDSTKITELENGIYEYTSQINDIEYYGRLLNVGDSELTMCVCRILPDESKEYKDALKSCYKSINYIKDNDTLEDIEKEAQEKAENAQEITSGNLYESIKSIDKSAYNLLKIEDAYSLSLITDTPKTFFSKCEKIYKKAFKKNKSVVFSMITKDKEDIASLTVIRDDSNGIAPIYSTLITYDDNKEKSIQAAYSKNKYWQSVDYNNQSEKALNKIINKYSN